MIEELKQLNNFHESKETFLLVHTVLTYVFSNNNDEPLFQLFEPLKTPIERHEIELLRLDHTLGVYYHLKKISSKFQSLIRKL